MPYNWADTPAGKRQAALNKCASRRDEFRLAQRRLVVSIRQAQEEGCSVESIAKKLEVSKSTITRWLKEFS